LYGSYKSDEQRLDDADTIAGSSRSGLDVSGTEYRFGLFR